jgi:SAM-dependent methyltransferase
MKSTPVFSTYSHYYDLLYKDKDYIGESKYIKSLLQQHGLTIGEILEFGSGTGKHGCLLADNGYKVHGIERSAEMVSLASVGLGFTCEQGDICKLDLGRTFDAVLSLFHVISYQTSNESVMAVIASAAKHLRPRGLFIFDFWYSPAVYAQHPTVRVKRMTDEQVEITRLAEPIDKPNENVVDVNYTIFAQEKATGAMQITKETHPMRHFSLPEIDLYAQQSGFRRIGAEEFLTGHLPDINTWGVCVILQKE